MTNLLKNLTPRQVSAYIAGATALLLLFLLLVFRATGWIAIDLRFLAVLAVLFFLGSFFIALYCVRYFIYRRIKVIYKVIHRQKTPADFRSKINMSANPLEDVEREVAAWASEYQKELDEARYLAQYRRQFIGDVSHELKTPIFNIQGFIHTLLDGAIADPQVSLLYLQRAAQNVDRIQAIVEDLGAISRLESGQIILELREFDIRELADEVFTDLEMRAKDAQIRLTYKEGAGSHFRARADRESIRQVLTNLILNSIKYGKKGGVTKVSFYDMSPNILIEVSDNGIGIAQEHLPHLFDRFYRVDKSRSRDEGGTGLGLAIVKHIVEAHKQTINVRSNPDQGSTFGFTLEKA